MDMQKHYRVLDNWDIISVDSSATAQLHLHDYVSAPGSSTSTTIFHETTG
jgi:hypothetical protein